MRFTFTVEVEVERIEGKFAARDEIQAVIQEALEGADPGNISGDNGGEYEVTSWEVDEQDQPKRRRVKPVLPDLYAGFADGDKQPARKTRKTSVIAVIDGDDVTMRGRDGKAVTIVDAFKVDDDPFTEVDRKIHYDRHSRTNPIENCTVCTRQLPKRKAHR